VSRSVAPPIATRMMITITHTMAMAALKIQ
jgi:FlaG/FlaF family flagellin (archaellin)